MDGDCENRANVHLSSCMCKHVCMCVCVCVCVCVQPNPIGRVYFVAGRGKQMAGCVAELYGVQHTHTHTHTHSHSHAHTQRERERPSRLDPSHPSLSPLCTPTVTQNHTEPHKQSPIYRSVLVFSTVFLFSPRAARFI